MSARVAFFSEHLPPSGDAIAGFSFDLMRTLADQQYTFRVYSTYSPGAELPPSHPRIEVMRPFQRWGWLEIPRLIPLLIDFQPEIIHVVEPRAFAVRGLTNALSAIPHLLPFLGRPRLVTSFFDLRASDLKKHAALLRASHAVTVANRPQHHLVSDFLADSNRDVRVAVVPMALRTSMGEFHGNQRNHGEALGSINSETLSAFVEHARPLVVVPGDIDMHRDPKALFHALGQVLRARPDVGIVFAGSWGGLGPPARHALMRIFEEPGLGSQVLVSGPIDGEQMRALLRRSNLVFAASLPAEALNLARLFRVSLEVAAPLMIGEHQLEADALRWRHRENVWVTGSQSAFWEQALQEALSAPELLAEIRRHAADFARTETLDHPGNVMSRLYSELLAHT